VAPEYGEEQQLEEVLANVVASRSRQDLEKLHELTLGLDNLDYSLKSLAESGLVRGAEPTKLGAAAAAHFFSPEMVKLVQAEMAQGKPALEIAVALECFEDIYLKQAERISTVLKMRISQRAFHGSYLDLLSSPELRSLERSIQKECLSFAKDFMRCKCMDSPYCGCPQKKSSLRILELRAEGKSPGEIIDEFSDRYGMYAYQGDLINYLDQMVRYLEAIEAIARVLGKADVAKEAGEMKKGIEGE